MVTLTNTNVEVVEFDIRYMSDAGASMSFGFDQEPFF